MFLFILILVNVGIKKIKSKRKRNYYFYRNTVLFYFLPYNRSLEILLKVNFIPM